MAEHTLKTLAPYWHASAVGTKTFEVRKNDRNYQAGDIVHLLWQTDQTQKLGDYTLGQLSFRIGYVLEGGQFGLEPGYVAFSLLPLEPTPAGRAALAEGDK